MGKKYYYKPKKSKKIWSKLFGVLFLLWLIGEVGFDSETIAGFVVLSGMTYGGYKLIKGGLSLFSNQASLDKHNINLQLQDLKDAIRKADKQVNVLESYLAKKELTQYGVLARQVLPQIESIKTEAERLKPHMDLNIYRRITKKANDVTDDITMQLKLLDLPTEAMESNSEEEHIMSIAPEILTTYRNIQRDHKTILEKINESDNQIELKALHETNMRRFEDILTGYLKIKAAPKNFHNADERLEKAKKALEQFDLELDQSLRELNESDLADFEVSLRMMTKPSHDPLQDSTLD